MILGRKQNVFLISAVYVFVIIIFQNMVYICADCLEASPKVNIKILNDDDIFIT